MKVCAWCSKPAPAGVPSSWRFCDQGHRQAHWRFGRHALRAARARQPLRLAFADPPYPGKAHLYADQPSFAGEVDHGALLDQLAGYDGWVLCTDSPALPELLALAAARNLAPRVAAWVRGAPNGVRKHPKRAWEPVLYVQAREEPAALPWDEDVLVHRHRPRSTDPAYVIGSKPPHFVAWALSLCRARPGDSLDDLFPGTGGVGRFWRLLEERALLPGFPDVDAHLRFCQRCRAYTVPDDDSCSGCARDYYVASAACRDDDRAAS